MMNPSKCLHLWGCFTSYLNCHILVWCWTNPEGVVRVQAGGGVRSTEPLLKAWCEQQPRRGGRMTTSYTSYRCSATPSGLLISYHRQAGVTLRSRWQNDNFIHFISLLCHPFGVVDFISPSSRGYASLHHLPVVVPALRASLHNQLPYKINYSFVRQFYFRNLNFYIPYRRFFKDGCKTGPYFVTPSNIVCPRGEWYRKSTSKSPSPL